MNLSKTFQLPSLPALSVVVLVSVAIAHSPGQLPHEPGAPKTNEERAEERLNDKRYLFEDLLKRKPEAVANTEQIFALSSIPERKMRAASILVYIGVKDAIYWDYLVAAVKHTLEDDTPWPYLYDKNGNRLTKITKPVADWMQKYGMDPNDPELMPVRSYNPAFFEWCRQHNKEPNEARQELEYEIPIPIMYLGTTADPRAYDLLVQGLQSHNLLIAIHAGEGLAILQDPRAIPELIEIGHQLPVEARMNIAWDLLYFSDPKAQVAAEELAPDQKLLEGFRDEVKKKGVKGLLPW